MSWSPPTGLRAICTRRRSFSGGAGAAGGTGGTLFGAPGTTGADGT
nr:hypothetical protein [Mycobacterium tuberculosis]